MVERLNRAPSIMARIGSQHNASEIEDIIMQKRWPKFECKTCGKLHDASLEKLYNSQAGGQFRFCEAPCPDAPSAQA